MFFLKSVLPFACWYLSRASSGSEPPLGILSAAEEEVGPLCLHYFSVSVIKKYPDKRNSGATVTSGLQFKRDTVRHGREAMVAEA